MAVKKLKRIFTLLDIIGELKEKNEELTKLNRQLMEENRSLKADNTMLKAQKGFLEFRLKLPVVVETNPEIAKVGVKYE